MDEKGTASVGKITKGTTDSFTAIDLQTDYGVVTDGRPSREFYIYKYSIISSSI